MGKPEKIFEKEFIWHLKNLGWSVDVIDSKAQYSAKLKQYKRSTAAKKGFSDLVCVMPNGRAAYIELKALNKKNTIRLEQLEFLKDKLKYKAFVCVAWSIEQFDLLLKEFHQSRGENLQSHLDALRISH